jgi:hypothetical protein
MESIYGLVKSLKIPPQDSHNWVMAFYRATGQAHKPAPPVTTGKTTTLSKNQGDADRARKHGKRTRVVTFNVTRVFLAEVLNNFLGGLKCQRVRSCVADPVPFLRPGSGRKNPDLGLTYQSLVRKFWV